MHKSDCLNFLFFFKHWLTLFITGGSTIVEYKQEFQKTKRAKETSKCITIWECL